MISKANKEILLDNLHLKKRKKKKKAKTRVRGREMKTILSCPRGSFDLWFSKAPSVLISFERACVTLSSFPIINQSLTQRNKKFTKSRRASSLGISEEYKTAFPPCKESGPFPYISLKQHLTTHVQFLQLSPHSPSP